MNLYVLDTDHLTLLARGHEQVTLRLDTLQPEQVCVSIISVEEQLAGWYTFLRKARSDEERELGYRRLLETVALLRRCTILPYTLTAIRRANELRKQFRRLGKMDLAIAAIVLDHGATLVTRNSRDFQSGRGKVSSVFKLPLRPGCRSPSGGA